MGGERHEASESGNPRQQNGNHTCQSGRRSHCSSGSWRQPWLPTIGAAVALERKDPNRAVELLKAASTIELSQPAEANVVLCPVYLRGEAYLMLHDGNAAVEFQKFIDHRGLVGNFPWGALARLGLARAYALQGNTAKAKAAYQDFLALWKDADPDIPILKEAKTEYAKLK
jgi:eukaryotic-like serine/threonine-protein kinase